MGWEDTPRFKTMSYSELQDRVVVFAIERYGNLRFGISILIDQYMKSLPFTWHSYTINEQDNYVEINKVLKVKSLNPTTDELCVSTLLHNFKLKNKERRQQGLSELKKKEYLINVDIILWKEDFKVRFKRLDYYLKFAKFSKNSKSYNPNKYKLKKK